MVTKPIAKTMSLFCNKFLSLSKFYLILPWFIL
jgi:hypothetical protein